MRLARLIHRRVRPAFAGSDASHCHAMSCGVGQIQISTSGTRKEAFGDGSDWLVLDLGLEAQQLDRGALVEPLTLHDEIAGLLDAGVMFHRKPQRRRKRLLLMGRGQLQGRHDQPHEGIGGREVLGLPRLWVGTGEVERADRAMTLTHRHAQPCPDAFRQRQWAEVGPAWLAGKIPARNWRILQECVHRRAFAESRLRTRQGASGPARGSHVAQLLVAVEQQQAHPAGAVAAGRGGLDDPLQHGLLAELDQVQARKLAQRRGDLGRVAGHGRLLRRTWRQPNVQAAHGCRPAPPQ
jgi:hypothetical protein